MDSYSQKGQFVHNLLRPKQISFIHSRKILEGEYITKHYTDDKLITSNKKIFTKK